MEHAENKIGVLFVCTGNICRSPTAEAVFRHQARQAGLEDRFLIQSAGTHGYHVGEPPDPRTIATALARGIDMSSLRARKLNTEDFDHFDYIFAMDAGHLSFLTDMHRNRPYKAALSLYLDFPAANNRQIVPDPYYGEQKDFDLVYDVIERQTGIILSHMTRKHSSIMK